MADQRLMDQALQRLVRSLVESGRALHYAELSGVLGCSVEARRRLLLAVLQAYPIGWLHPDTDYIASFPPLNNLLCRRPCAVLESARGLTRLRGARLRRPLMLRSTRPSPDSSIHRGARLSAVLAAENGVHGTDARAGVLPSPCRRPIPSSTIRRAAGQKRSRP